LNSFRIIKILIFNWIALMVAIAPTATLNVKTALASTASFHFFNFKLVGTAVVEGHRASMAVVEIDGRRQGLFREGDMVGSVRIKRILPDRIIVDAQDGEQVVQLLRYFRAGVQSRPGATLSSQTIQPFVPRPPGSRSLQVVRLDQRVKESLLGEVDQALKEVFVDPVIVYGQPTGVRITPIEPGSIFSELGLKQGDVLLEVKGKQVTDPQDAIALFELIRKGGEFDIKVKGRRTRRIHMIAE
jgi:general secretion pathway protein C